MGDDDTFFQNVKHLVANVLSEESEEPYKAVIQGIMQMFHQTKSSYFKHRNPIPFLNKFIFTEKVPVDISLEKAMSKGWSTPHLIYRLFKNLTNEIFVIQSTSDEDKINFVLDQIRLNPGYHVAFASFKTLSAEFPPTVMAVTVPPTASLCKSAFSTANSSYGLMTILTLDKSTLSPDICIFEFVSGTCLTSTAIFTIVSPMAFPVGFNS